MTAIWAISSVCLFVVLHCEQFWE